MKENSTLYTYTSNLLKTDYSKKSLFERTIGKFYTPQFICDDLLSSIPKPQDILESNTIKIIDPFCGDGRLIYNYIFDNIKDFKKIRSEIHLWDIDKEALETAKKHLQDIINDNELSITLSIQHYNSFFIDLDQYNGYFDLCLTNPPWETLKPDSRELKSLTTEEKEQYIEKLRTFDDKISALYPTSQPKIKFSGWGTNLARVGIEVSLKLIRNRGKAGIISPSSFFADSQSRELRKWFMLNFTIEQLNFYKAETKLFSRVDQDTCSFIVNKAKIDSISLNINYYNKNLVRETFENIKLENLDDIDYRLPNYFGLKAKDILFKLNKYSKLKEFKSDEFWSGRELDESRDKYLLSSNGKYPFLKGRMVKRYGVFEESTLFVAKENRSKLPKSLDFYRLVWRDVSRSNQKRRMKASIIPPGIITGNSLNVAYFVDNDLKKLLALLALMNSTIFELQVRSVLSTSHMSVGAIRSGRIPPIDDVTSNKYLMSLVEKCLETNGDDIELMKEIDEIVCQEYDLPKDCSTYLTELF